MEIGRNTPTYIAYYIFLLSFGGGWWLAKRRWQDDDDDDDSRGREPTLGSGALSFFPAPSLPATPGVSVCVPASCSHRFCFKVLCGSK